MGSEMESAHELDLRWAFVSDFELDFALAAELDFELDTGWELGLENVWESALDGGSAMVWDSTHRDSCIYKYPGSRSLPILLCEYPYTFFCIYPKISYSIC